MAEHDFDGYGMCRCCGRGNLEVERGEAPESCQVNREYHAAVVEFERLVAEAEDAPPAARGKES